MFRLLFKNKETGEKSAFWSYFTDKKPHYFRDVSLTDEVNISEYEQVDFNDGTTSVLTPYQLFGVECERGWYHLLQPVIDYIDNYNIGKAEKDMIYITQVKEKYGTLVIYVSSYTPELGKLIEEAELKSGGVCEMCGTEDNVGSTLGWYVTICHDCLKKRCKTRDESVKWRSYSNDNVYWVNPDSDDEFIETFQEYEEGLP